ncbi:sensor histidine kinase [Thalassobacter stenotrophicus]|uniref:sensor histidine kinase n=1 Tax=Thalassobacter stenotrophicus TaxID=266809 RepID=UPI0022A8ED3D|nr:histidine kinase dimerization/phospho-acceptor domain-containing protein [Thalassobacter stenotrophicus]UYP68403.1 sensor histidine kinase [Thalassobacter stenotrophicus]
MSRDISLNKVFAVLLALVCAELCIMLALAWVEKKIPWLTEYVWGEAVLDALLLFFIMTPIFYLLLIRPLQRANAIKLRFLEMISDDLRNPLNALQGIVMASCEDPSLTDKLERARQEAMTWMQLRVERVLVFSALEAEVSLQNGLPIDLLALSGDIQKRFDFMFTTRGNKLDVLFEGSNSSIASAQAEILMQLVFSMLDLMRMAPNDTVTHVEVLITHEAVSGVNVNVSYTEGDATTGENNRLVDGPFEQTALARNILKHMAARAGCVYQSKNFPSQTLVMPIEQPNP